MNFNGIPLVDFPKGEVTFHEFLDKLNDHKKLIKIIDDRGGADRMLGAYTFLGSFNLCVCKRVLISAKWRHLGRGGGQNAKLVSCSARRVAHDNIRSCKRNLTNLRGGQVSLDFDRLHGPKEEEDALPLGPLLWKI